MIIQSTWDVATARNVCRKVILGQKLPPSFCARSVAAIAVLGELILLSHSAGTLEIRVVPQRGKQGVELRCSIPLSNGQSVSLETARSQLARAVDAIDINNQDNQLTITAHLWSA